MSRGAASCEPARDRAAWFAEQVDDIEGDIQWLVDWLAAHRINVEDEPREMTAGGAS